MKHDLKVLALIASVCLAVDVRGQQKPPAAEVAGIPINYDESKVGTYTLPNVLMLQNGKPVKTASDWTKKRRPEIVSLYEENQFGKMPGRPSDMTFDVFDKGTPAYDGKALRKQVTVYFTKDTSKYKMDLLIYLPANAIKPAPLMLVANFSANSNATDDPGVRPSMMWSRDGKRVPAPKGGPFGKLAIEKYISQGIGVATMCYTDIEPDVLTGIANGIRGHYLKSGAIQPEANEWGAVSAWAWGISRAMDYFETDNNIDAKRIAIQGTSRLGKTVLWAGAHDERIAMVIASCSGEGGAALSRRNYGETIKHLVAPTRYPYQFAANYGKYGDNVSGFPVDGHMLVSLMAPRPVLLQTGDTDVWSDPKGEFLAALAAEPVYKLFGKKGPGTEAMPQAGQKDLLNPLGYYMHLGGHGTIATDWDVYLEFIKKYL